MTDQPHTDLGPLLAVLDNADGPVSRLARRLRRVLDQAERGEALAELLEACRRAAGGRASHRALVARLCRALVEQLPESVAVRELFEQLIARLARDPLPEVWEPAARAFGVHAVRQGKTDWILTGGPGGAMQDTFRRRVYPALAAAVGAGWEAGLRWLEQGLARSGDVWDQASVLLGLSELSARHPERVRSWVEQSAGSDNRILRWQLAGVLARSDWPESLGELLLAALEQLHRQTLVMPQDLTNIAFEVELRESLRVLAGRLSDRFERAAELESRLRERGLPATGTPALSPPEQPEALLDVLRDDTGPAAERVAAAAALCRVVRRRREGAAPGQSVEGWIAGLVAGGAGLAEAAFELASLLASLPAWIGQAARETRQQLGGDPGQVYAAVRVHEEVVSGAGLEAARLLAGLRPELSGALPGTFDQLVALFARERMAAAERWVEAVLPRGKYWLTLRLLDWIHRTPELEPQAVLVQLSQHWDSLPRSLLSRRIPALLADLHERFPEERRQDWAERVAEFGRLARGDEVLARSAAWAGAEVDETERTPLEQELRRLGRYRILEEVGRGGFGSVYRSVHPVLGIDVAIKVPRPEVLHDDEQQAFLREARLLARLTARGGARHVLRVYDADFAYTGPTRTIYVVMEYVAEGSLFDRLTKVGPLPPAEAAEIIRQSALGVEAAHRLEPPLVHRDIKPGNLLLRDTPFGLEVSVADFGGAAYASTGSEHILCSIGYTAPEVFEGVIAPSVDIYGLGAVLYDCLAGQPPFPRTTIDEYRERVMRHDPPALREVRPEVPQALADIVARAMARDPAGRPASAAALAEELTAFLEGR